MPNETMGRRRQTSHPGAADDKGKVEQAVNAAMARTWREARLATRRLRRVLAPVEMMVFIFLLGLLLHHLSLFENIRIWTLHGSAVAFAAGFTLTYVWWFIAWRFHWLAPDAGRPHRRSYAVTGFLLATAWLSAVIDVDPAKPPMPALLVIAGTAMGLPWWWRHRILTRTAELEPVAELVEEVLEGEIIDPRIKAWQESVACPRGPLENSLLRDLEELRGGWVGTIELLQGNTNRARMAVLDIGARLKLRAGSVFIEPPPEGELHLAKIMVLTKNPLAGIISWTGPTLNVETGVSILGMYADGELVPYRHYRAGSGPVHTLISGSTDSGKSRTVEQLLAEERHSGVIVSQVVDPQGGASLPDWQDHVERYARNISEARELLELARARMYARNNFMASVEWRDDQGRVRKGLGQFTPMDPRHRGLDGRGTPLPLLSITIDEAQTILADKTCKELVEEMLPMSRKCGIKFRLITQVPLLTSLGNSMVIRDAVAAGNVIVLRTANRLTSQVAFNGGLAVDPSSLPKEWPGGASTSGLGFVFAPGADRASAMRVGLIDDPFYWATSGEPAELEFFEYDPEKVEPRRPALSAQRSETSEDLDEVTAAEEAEEEAQKGVGEQAVLDYLAQRPGELVERGKIVIDIQASMGAQAPALRTLTNAFKTLTESGQIEKEGRGNYRVRRAA